MKNSTKLLSLILIGLVFFSCNTTRIVSKKKAPNFILILTDDQGWNGTSVQMMDEEIRSKSDYHQTPNLETLAKKACVFLPPMRVLQSVLPQDIVFSLDKRQLGLK